MGRIELHPIYRSILFPVFVNKLIKNGKKLLSEKILNCVFNIIKSKQKTCPLLILETAIKVIKVPIQIQEKKTNNYNKYILRSNVKASFNAIKWIIYVSKQQKGIWLEKSLSTEILNIFTKDSSLITKKFNYIKNAISKGIFFHPTKTKVSTKNKLNQLKLFQRKFFLEQTILVRLHYLKCRFQYITSFY